MSWHTHKLHIDAEHIKHQISSSILDPQDYNTRSAHHQHQANTCYIDMTTDFLHCDCRKPRFTFDILKLTCYDGSHLILYRWMQSPIFAGISRETYIDSHICERIYQSVSVWDSASECRERVRMFIIQYVRPSVCGENTAIWELIGIVNAGGTKVHTQTCENWVKRRLRIIVRGKRAYVKISSWLFHDRWLLPILSGKGTQPRREQFDPMLLWFFLMIVHYYWTDLSQVDNGNYQNPRERELAWAVSTSSTILKPLNNFDPGIEYPISHHREDFPT